MKISFLVVFLLIAVGSFGQTAKVSISNYSQDSLRVSVYDIIKNPIINIIGANDAKIISYDLTLNINGEIHEWQEPKKDTLDKEKTQLLLEVKNNKPKYNQLFLERVKYIDSLGKEKQSEGLYLWLAKETDCNGIYDIETEKYKNKSQIKFEYFWCNDTCIKINNYRKDGTLLGTKESSYTPDTIIVTNLYRKDGSKAIYEREVNGKDDGDYFIYYPDGSIKLESKNINGIRIHEKKYNSNGNLISESNCDNTGENCTVQFFDSDGKVKKEKSFKYKGLKYKAEW